MRLIKGGGFNMGDTSGLVSTATPVRFVKVSSFYMDETPVTVADFQEYIKAGGTLPNYWTHPNFQKKDIPVTGITWNLAADYCNWRSKVEGLEPAYEISEDKDYWGNSILRLNESANGYRLPTEAEFEYAARGGLLDNTYPWGEEFEKTYANFDNEHGIPLGNWVLLAEVNTQKSNDFGLKGMAGNIWHWCNDWYDYKYSEDVSGKNPLGPQVGDTKVLRGGSWGSTEEKQLAVFYRNKAAIGSYNYDIGFRCVRPVKRGILKTLKDKRLNTKVAHEFLQPRVATASTLEVDFRSEDFKQRLKKYLNDNYSHSLYFKEAVGNQEKINADQLVETMVDISLRYKVNPVFVASVMIAETGMATVSLARWANNPLAFNWKMPDLSGNPVVLASNNFKISNSYYNLNECFYDFLGYLSQSSVKTAAYSDFFDFQRYLHHEERPYFIQSVARVYRDLLGIRIEEDFPRSNVGRLIYTDWKVNDKYEAPEELPLSTDPVQEKEIEEAKEDIIKKEQAKKVAKEQPVESNKIIAQQKTEPPIKKERDAAPTPPKRNTKKLAYYLVVKQDLDVETASILAKQLRGKGFPEAGVIPYREKNAITLKEFSSEAKAKAALNSLSELFSDIKVIGLEK